MKIIKTVKVEVRDKYGQLKTFKKITPNSLVRGWIDLHYILLAQLTLNNLKDNSGTLRNCSNSAGVLSCNAGAGDSVQGIQVGTGSAAVSLTDYQLQSKIAHGNGAGQLSYQIMTFTTPATVGNTHSFTAARSFTNNSGSQINVTEIGLSNGGWAGAWYYFLVERTLLSFSIANGATGTVTYTIQISV